MSEKEKETETLLAQEEWVNMRLEQIEGEIPQLRDFMRMGDRERAVMFRNGTYPKIPIEYGHLADIQWELLKLMKNCIEDQ